MFQLPIGSVFFRFVMFAKGRQKYGNYISTRGIRNHSVSDALYLIIAKVCQSGATYTVMCDWKMKHSLHPWESVECVAT